MEPVSLQASVRVLADGTVVPEEGEIEGTRGPRVQVGETEYYYELDPGTVTPERVASGAVIWQYDGQATFHDEDPSEAVANTWTVPDRMPGPDNITDYYGVGIAQRVDR